MVDESLDFLGRHPAARGNFPSSDAVVEIDQHLAQIKNMTLAPHAMFLHLPSSL